MRPFATLLLLLALSAEAQTDIPAPKPTPAPDRVQFNLWTGAASLITRGERREYWAGRATLNVDVSRNMVGFLRVDLLGTQDGGNLDTLDPASFRSLEGALGLRHRVVDRLSVGFLGGVTWSIEGDEGAPVDPRLWTALGVLRYALDEHGSYVYVGCGLHDPVGGGACALSVSQQMTGGDHPTATFADFALPFDSNAFAEKTWTLKIGVSVRAWSR